MDAMQVLSAAEMQACDRATSEQFGVPSSELMRSASRAVASFALENFPQARCVLVLCGHGNNGGDGMMAARFLTDMGLKVTAIFLGEPDGLKGDSAIAWQEMNEANKAAIHIVTGAEQLASIADVREADLIIDAVLGTGFKPPMKGLALDTLNWVKNFDVPILSVDLPSGWTADSTEYTASSSVYPSDAVVTFTAPKPAHVFGQLTRKWDDPIVVAPIGSPEGAIVSQLQVGWTGSAMEIVQPRATDANKGKYGHVLVVGGTFGSAGGKAGAPAMAALASLRIGAGLVTAAVPAAAMSVASAIAPELMTWGLRCGENGAISEANLSSGRLEALMDGKTVLAVGPGMGQAPETAHFFFALLDYAKVPAVIDADALNLLAAQTEVLTEQSKGRMVVLTPHPGEMARLTGLTTAEIQANRVEIAHAFAERMGVTVVLKGARTIVAHPSGRIVVNTTGNPGMAKGGSGDLLTGFIAGMIAQFPEDRERAVEAAVYLHGLAADLAVNAGDEHTFLATDCLAYLPQAFKLGVSHFHNFGKSGYVWLQGAARECEAAGKGRG
jgi:ADP-dependent NAD(P)H-hydrate dehydratase / NAD(P)H-hydrate epimerase